LNMGIVTERCLTPENSLRTEAFANELNIVDALSLKIYSRDLLLIFAAFKPKLIHTVTDCISS